MSKRKIYLSYDQMRQIARYDITFPDLLEEDESLEDVEFVCTDTYIYSLDDIVRAVKNIYKKEMHVDEFKEQWLQPMRELSKDFNLHAITKKKANASVFWQFLIDSPELEITDDMAFSLFWNLVNINQSGSEPLRISSLYESEHVIEGFERLRKLRKVPIEKWDFNDWEKLAYLSLFKNKEIADKAGNHKTRLAEVFIDSLLEREDEIAIEYLDTDDILMMGDLFYYGFQDHSPNYSKAFDYYSIAAANQDPAGMYKLADLYLSGKGCSKDWEMAYILYQNSYKMARKAFLKGEPNCLADAAYRLGNMSENEPKSAYTYYLEAQYAIHASNKESNYFGNIPIQDQIEKALEESSTFFQPKEIHNEEVIYNLPDLFIDLCKDNYPCELTISSDETERLKLTSKRLATQSVPNPEEIMIVIPEGSFCQSSHALSYMALESAQLWTKDDAVYLRYDFCEWDVSKKRFKFYDRGDLVASVTSDTYYFRCETQEMEYWIASISFTGDQRVYNYICPFEVEQGDRIMIDGYTGNQEASIVDIDLKKESELSFPIEQYKVIKQKA